MENSTGLSYLGDLREYIEELRKIGELVEVQEEVDWNLEVGAIIRRCYETGSSSPAVQLYQGSQPWVSDLGCARGRQPAERSLSVSSGDIAWLKRAREWP